MAERRRSNPSSDGVSKGLYANYFEVGHTAFEFVIDFGEAYANRRSGCHTRIVTSPTYARALLQTLSDALDDYHRRFETDK